VRERVDHLRLTGQRHGLVKGTIIFGALAIAVLILGGDRYLLLFALFAALSLACFVSWLRRRGARPRKTDPAQPGLLLSLARRLRQQPYVVVGYRFIARTVAPAVFLGLGTFAAVSVAHRTVFDLLSTVGTYCKATEKDGSPENKNDNSEQEKLGVGKILFTNSMCHETGLSLISGRKYRIALEMDDVWFDKDVRTDVGGFSAASVNRPLFYLASPLKRWWQENWFQPIARIGAVGNYEQALKPAEPLPLAGPGIQPSKLLVSDITADATGELFLYVNDAVVTWFGLTDWFYRNNKGSAKVTVTTLVAPQMIETQK
jgi:hypothetical protein